MIASLVDQCLRRERARILGSLFRVCRDLSAAEEALQDASLQAMTTWPTDGPPDKPGAWLYVVARRRLIDSLRRDARWQAASGSVDDDSGDGDGRDPLDQLAQEAPPVEGSGQDRDDRLRLLFACCNASLPERARIGLALRSLLGLSTREIARAFLEDEATTAKRLVRAKQAVKQTAWASAGTAADLGVDERMAAIDLVLRTLYLVFNEGYLAAEGESLVRQGLVDDAIELAELVVDLLPWHAESHGLLALMLLHGARRAARVNSLGELVTLDEQDRGLWDAAMIRRGTAVLDRALALRAASAVDASAVDVGVGVGVYLVQAAISSLHANAAHADDTDWLQIAGLYRLQLSQTPSPVVELNAAVALAMAGQQKEALAWVNALEKDKRLADYHLLAAVKAHLLEGAGHRQQAIRLYRRARRLTNNEAERRFLTRRIEALENTPTS